MSAEKNPHVKCPTPDCGGTVAVNKCANCLGSVYMCTICDAVKYHCIRSCDVYEAHTRGWGRWKDGRFVPLGDDKTVATMEYVLSAPAGPRPSADLRRKWNEAAAAYKRLGAKFDRIEDAGLTMDSIREWYGAYLAVSMRLDSCQLMMLDEKDKSKGGGA